ncbi:CCN family member 2 [Phlebotomus argentipes]|uniref:CCN family member 2 n=1 Tax=Phlebotomus argentipes TaxID=94469 RepID=UPI00289322CB|nr:CCN family member 2 [Phlebotomus argentipes]
MVFAVQLRLSDQHEIMAQIFTGCILLPLLLSSSLAFSINTDNEVDPVRTNLEQDCTVGNATFLHGEIFKVNCKTQCVCQNGRHACSSLCPHESISPPGSTSECRSPRLVEVSGYCCKIWLCEMPSTDVNVTCGNSSTTPWTQCSEECGVGVSTRHVETPIGCRDLTSVRLCENRQCVKEDKVEEDDEEVHSAKKFPLNLYKHRKGHGCRKMQKMGPSRIRLGPCVSRRLYRPKICGLCQNSNMNCVPSLSTTIQVEFLCPLNSGDPINFIETGYDLWDNSWLDPIDQELLHSRNIQMENKFIGVQWILKCSCGSRFSLLRNILQNDYDSM